MGRGLEITGETMEKTLSSSSRKGFTLIEILMVIVVIGILGGIVMAASSYITKVARDKRTALTRTVLETAVYRYRAEYGDWPVGAGENASGDTDEKVTKSGEDNKSVFGPLRMSSSQNPDAIQFIDESSLFTWDSGKKAIVPLMKAEGGKDVPLVYLDRDGDMKYFSVTINFVDETVTVR